MLLITCVTQCFPENSLAVGYDFLSDTLVVALVFFTLELLNPNLLPDFYEAQFLYLPKFSSPHVSLCVLYRICWQPLVRIGVLDTQYQSTRSL